MKAIDIKSKNFYTDGIRIFFKDGKKIVEFCKAFEGNDLFLKRGVYIANSTSKTLLNDVRLVEPGEEFFNGQIKVLDRKTLDIFKIDYENRKFDDKGYTINPDEVKYIETRKIFKL